MSEHNEGELLSNVTDDRTLAAITKSEIDQQVSTAKKYPRSISHFVAECKDLVMLNENVAKECMYVLKRQGRDGAKTIEGPSSRLAEIVMSCWGNCRAGARVISEQHDFIVAQGVFHDLERNVYTSYEVRRRITTREGHRYSADMIGVTGNAACSIALRNAVFKGVPKAFWNDIYDTAKRTALGGEKSIEDRRKNAINYWKEQGVTEEQLFRYLGIDGEKDIGLPELMELIGLVTAIKEGDTTLDQAFSEHHSATQSEETTELNESLKKKAEEKKAEEKPARKNHSQQDDGDFPEFTRIDVKAKITTIGDKLDALAEKQKPTKKDWQGVCDMVDDALDVLGSSNVEDDERATFKDTLLAQRAKAEDNL